MLFPLLFLAVAIAYMQNRRPEPSAPPPPPEHAQDERVETWLGQGITAGGGQLLVSLSRSHADPTRQEFETGSLARQFDLESGEPWRLELRLVGDEGTPSIDPTKLRVEDGQGMALQPLPAVMPEPAPAVTDPVAVLFGTPRQLPAGETMGIVAWGRAPVGPARLVGFGGEVELFSRQSDASASGENLAHLENKIEAVDGLAVPADGNNE